ncbi:MAG: hypothetical protein RL172_2333 [Bacteroidota bacterium]
MTTHFALHHYGFLTANTTGWLAENEALFGKPFLLHNTISISSQKVNITFVQQTQGAVLVELIEPWPDNKRLQKMLEKGITIYHSGYKVAAGKFDAAVDFFTGQQKHALPVFASEAFNNKRCVFIVTKQLGLIELIEE